MGPIPSSYHVAPLCQSELQSEPHDEEGTPMEGTYLWKQGGHQLGIQSPSKLCLQEGIDFSKAKLKYDILDDP